MRRRDRGESLIEVVIATAILSLLGLTIVGSIVMIQPLTDKVNVTGQALANLNSAAEQIQLQGFKTCTPSNPEPYAISSTNFIPDSSASGTFTITTAALPLGQTPSGGTSHSYSTSLSAAGGNGIYVWTVSPKLPNGLTLSSSGTISGTPETESSKIYKFTATSNGLTATKSLTLTIVTISVQVNDSTIAWAPCQNVPVGTISGATATGSTITFTYSAATSLLAGDVVTISGITPINLNLISVPVVSATATQFVVASTVSATYQSGGTFGLTKNVNVQQIVVTTSVGARQISRTIVAAI